MSKRKASFTLAGRPTKARARSFQGGRAIIPGRQGVLRGLPPTDLRVLANVRTGGFMALERKFKDYNDAADAFSTVWAAGEMEDATALSLSAVAQGDGESERDGRVYHIHSVHLKGFVKYNVQESQTAPIEDHIVRLALVWDTQTNGAQLNAEDVFVTIGAGEDINSFRNLQFSKRFVVLKDKTIKINLNNQTNEGAINLFANGEVRIPFKINKSFKTPIKVRCSGTTATVSVITDNSLHLIGTGTSTNAKVTYQSRIRFTG